MDNTKNQVYLKLHYQVEKKTFSIFREDTFFLPSFSEETHKGIIEHVKNIMQTGKDSYMILQRVENNGRMHKGFLPVSDYINVKMYEGKRGINNNSNGVITIRDWNTKEESFNIYGQNVTIKDFITALQDEIELQANWTNY